MSHSQVFISRVSFSPKLETSHSLFSFRQSSRVSPESRANPRTLLAVLSLAKYVYAWALVQLSNDCRERLRLPRLVIGLKISRQFFNQWEAEPKPIAPCTREFSRALSKWQVIVRNSDWFIPQFVPVVIGRSNYLGFGFSTVIWKPRYWSKKRSHQCSLNEGLFKVQPGGIWLPFYLFPL